jgi:hypothetical protein
LGNDNIKVLWSLVVRQVAGRRQDGKLELRIERRESSKLLDRRHRAILSPYEKGGLSEAPNRVADIDVEMSGEESGGSVPRAALM